MAIRIQWYRENAKDCAKRVKQSRDLLVKAAYQEMVRAWIMLAQSAELLARTKSIRPDLAKAVSLLKTRFGRIDGAARQG
jgi:hypothetical protein